MNPAEERFSARFLKRCRCVCCDQQLVDRVGVFLLVDQQMSRSTRVNFPVARGGCVVVYWYLESRILSDVVWISCCDAVSFSWNAAFWNFACDQQQESLLFVDSNQQMVERQVDGSSADLRYATSFELVAATPFWVVLKRRSLSLLLEAAGSFEKKCVC
ncbi:hypothetical protein F511_19506 [Dorcoceras hygrometricum]|uniref:Uncharacterized protein n=1 Tax=Dorcoceras hygrometricum TaxID=472368 RepID=A0A2Z7D9Q1_9LAMI|nr:hypothetical protein F511_19506 [Dorcoceras hygrometricum]